MNNRIATLLYSTDTEFLLFSTLPLFIEIVSPIRTSVAVHLMVSFTIDTFEDVRARLAFLCSKPWRSQLVVFFATSCLLPMVLRIVRSIAFDTYGCM